MGLKRRATRIASALFSVVLSVSIAKATPVPQQNPQPTKEGLERQSDLAITVVDPQDAVVSNVQVILSGPKTQPWPQAKGVTDNAGGVVFPSLAAGEYTITVKTKYFLTERQSVLLVAGKSANLVITMQTGKASTTVEVGGAEVPLIQKDAQVTHSFYLDR